MFDHNKLKKVIDFLNEKEMTNDNIIKDWTVKDIIAHIAAWNWEIINATDTVLSDKTPWYANKTEEEFIEELTKDGFVLIYPKLKHIDLE